VSIGSKQLLSVAHLGFSVGKTYNIDGSADTHYQVTCVAVSEKLDCALLRSEELPAVGTVYDLLCDGSAFCMLVSLRAFENFYGMSKSSRN
jgi:hypothetical protein